jgi:hypothetical protein
LIAGGVEGTSCIVPHHGLHPTPEYQKTASEFVIRTVASLVPRPVVEKSEIVLWNRGARSCRGTLSSFVWSFDDETEADAA